MRRSAALGSARPTDRRRPAGSAGRREETPGGKLARASPRRRTEGAAAARRVGASSRVRRPGRGHASANQPTPPPGRRQRTAVPSRSTCPKPPGRRRAAPARPSRTARQQQASSGSPAANARPVRADRDAADQPKAGPVRRRRRVERRVAADNIAEGRRGTPQLVAGRDGPKAAGQSADDRQRPAAPTPHRSRGILDHLADDPSAGTAMAYDGGVVRRPSGAPWLVAGSCAADREDEDLDAADLRGGRRAEPGGATCAQPAVTSGRLRSVAHPRDTVPTSTKSSTTWRLRASGSGSAAAGSPARSGRALSPAPDRRAAGLKDLQSCRAEGRWARDRRRAPEAEQARRPATPLLVDPRGGARGDSGLRGAVFVAPTRRRAHEALWAATARGRSFRAPAGGGRTCSRPHGSSRGRRRWTRPGREAKGLDSSGLGQLHLCGDLRVPSWSVALAGWWNP